MIKKKLFAKKCICFVAILALLIELVPTTVFAETTSEKIKKAEALKKRTEQQKMAVEEKKENLKDTKQQLQDYLLSLNGELERISDNLQQIEMRIAAKEKEVDAVKAEVVTAKEEEIRQYNLMKMHLRCVYEKGNPNLFETFLTTSAYADFLNKAEYIGKLEAYDQKMFEVLVEQRKLVEKKEKVLKDEVEQLNDLLDESQAEKNRVSTLVNSTSGTIAETSDAITAAELEEKAYASEIKEQEDSLKSLKKQLEEEQALSAKANKMSWSQAGELSFADGDRDLLACLIYCEAGGEPYTGQVAVGAVVVNRMRSAAFPNSMVGVIYQKKQFSPVGSGRLATRLSLGANDSCYRAADEAMAGVSPVGNCLFFRTVIPEIKGQIIGGHVFY